MLLAIFILLVLALIIYGLTRPGVMVNVLIYFGIVGAMIALNVLIRAWDKGVL